MMNKKWHNNIVDFLIESINEGFYIYFFVDESKIRISPLNKGDLTHDIFVYGYNDIDKIFYISGAFDNGKFTFGTCNYEETHVNVDLSKDWLHGFKLLKKIPWEYCFSMNYLVEELSDYLYSRNSVFHNERVFISMTFLGLIYINK